MTGEDAKPGSLLVRRLPGKARPRAEALADWHEMKAEMREDLPHVIRRFLLPDPNKYFRWRVALDCGCVIEEWTRGPDDFPDEHTRKEPFTRRDLLHGERQCHDESHYVMESGPYRLIVEWVESKLIKHEADEREDPYGIGAETWERIRRKRRRTMAHWIVKLECGHYADNAVTAPKWKPEDGPRLVTAKRAREMAEEYLAYADGGEHPEKDPEERAHWLRMIEQRWPIPETEERCYWCLHAHNITAYQRIGWLEEPPKPLPPPKPRRTVVEERLAKLEAEQEKLRKELAELRGTEDDE